jgi:PTS system mannose-specific IIC component
MRTTALILVATLPLAYLGAWAEQRYRKRQNLSYNKLILWNRRGVAHAFTPGRLVTQAMVEIFIMHFALFLACSSAVLVCIRLVPLYETAPQPGWPMLWIAAAAGAVLALRMRKSYALAGAALLLGVLATV